MSSDTAYTPRARVRAALAHQETDRIPIHDSLWNSTIARWRREGLPEGVSPNQRFGFELHLIGADLTPGYPVQVLEKTDEHTIETTPHGMTRRRLADGSGAQTLDYAVKTRAAWEETKKRLQPSRERIKWASLPAATEERFTCFYAVTGYDLIQSYIPTEDALPLLLTEPEWMRDMVETTVDMVIATVKLMLEGGFRFDGGFFFNDMGYRNGPLFSPRVYRELIKPADQRLFGFFHSLGLPVIVHSCGCVKPLIPDLIDAGLTCLQPLEVKAGMDVVELKKQYGKDLAFMGGIDVRTMSDPDPAAVEREIAAKIPLAKVGGGYIYHSDHTIPDDVSLDRYAHVIELVHKYGQF